MKFGLRLDLCRSLQTPAYPAGCLLFGMLFMLAAAHFMAIPWPRAATIAVYT